MLSITLTLFFIYVFVRCFLVPVFYVGVVARCASYSNVIVSKLPVTVATSNIRLVFI